MEKKYSHIKNIAYKIAFLLLLFPLLIEAQVTVTKAPGDVSFVVPAGVTCVTVNAWGGGGGGGGSDTNGEAGGGGGAGGHLSKVVTVTPGQTFTLNIGAGGNAGNSGNGNGGNGNQTQVTEPGGIVLTADRGNRGRRGSDNGGDGRGGSGGSASGTGATVTTPVASHDGVNGNSGTQKPGNGGTNTAAGSGAGGTGVANTTGQDGAAPGGGGAGGERGGGNRAGGRGGDGGVTFTYNLPNINVSGFAVGDTANFGDVDVSSGTQDVTFTIQNTVACTRLTLLPAAASTVTVGGADFTLQTAPSAAVINGVASLTFVVRFNPSALGLRTGTISIASDDADTPAYNFNIQGTGVEPDINLVGNALTISDGDATPDVADDTDFGDVLLTGGTKTNTFTIQNNGTGVLNLTGGTRVATSGHTADFTVTQPASATVGVGGTITFDVTFNPTATGTRSVTLTIASDDPDTASYDFVIRGEGIDPEINLVGNGVSIVNADATPDSGDHTDFGTIATSGATFDRTFTIQNIGIGDLTLASIEASRVTISGAEAADFSILTQPSSDKVAASGFLTFVVRFDPSATGIRNALLTITNDDSDESPYTFAISGTGSSKEINLVGNAVSIVDGDTTPSTADDTDFGDVLLAGGTVTHTFTIENTGSDVLNLTGGTLVASSGDTADFTITQPASATVGATSSITFDVTFNPTATGVRSVTLTIESDDADEATYDFVIQGTGVEPEINLVGNALSIVDGDVTPSLVDYTDFGNVIASSGTQVRTFTIENIGGATLNLDALATSRVTISGVDAADFTVSTQPSAATIAPSSSLTFQVTFDPSTTGLRYATLTIISDDADEGTYNFDIVGSGIDPEIDVTGNGLSIIDGDSTPSVTDHTDFGSVLLTGGTQVRTFTIVNTGTTALSLETLITNRVTISGTHAADFTISTQPSVATIAAGGTLTFDVTFDPSSTGARNATLTIVNDDFDEGTYNFDITGLGITPEINVTGNSVSIADGDITPTTADHTDFSTALVSGGTVVRTFTIQNIGSSVLSLAAVIADRVTVSGTHASDFTVTAQPSSATIAVSGSLTFQVTFNPSAEGVRNATLTITNNDADESIYDFAITGEGLDPEINILGNSISIVDGDLTPTITDHTDFGEAHVTLGTVVRTFTIENIGSSTLSLAALVANRVKITGPHSADFTVTTQPSASTIAASGSLTFQVTFDPLAIGGRNATLTITNNDTDESIYDFAIRGTGINPEINLVGNSISIVDGDITPILADHTDFGLTDIASATVVRTFTIQNIGVTPLDLATLAADRVTISGAHASDFTVTTQPASATIAASGSLTFQVTFNPSAIGVRNATINIINNDANETPYDFAIQGTGTNPEINLVGNSISIVDGDTTPTIADHTDFGNVLLAGGTVVRTYTIQNTGTTTLNLAAAAASRVTISGGNAADFTVTTQPSAATIAVGATLTFQVTFNPSAVGTRSTTLTITSDDADEATYDFAIQGTGVEPEINLVGNAVSIVDGDVTPAAADHTDFGNVNLTGATLTRTFTIQNIGTSTLNLAAAAASRVTISGGNAADFTVISQPSAATIAAAGSLTFQVRFDPSATGVRSTTLIITSDDADESTYDFTIQGTGIVPQEINLVGNSQTIVDGDVSPSVLNDTDFGIVGSAAGTIVKTFTIENLGTNLLSLQALVANRVTVSGTNAADFVVTTQPSAATIAGGANLTFQVTFNPSADGVRNAVLTILNDDADEATYDFAIRGTGAGQEIDITGNAVSIVDGDITPSLADHTDFGNVDFGGSTRQRTYTILNIGTENLSLGATTITGADAADFAITTNPVSPVTLGGGSTTLGITFDPSSVGVKNATITVSSNDPDEGTYTFDIRGTGVSEPEIYVSGVGVEIVNGSTPLAANDTSFGSVSLGNPSIKTYTITNNGTQTLNIGSTSKTGADFTITTAPAATVAPGASTTIQVTFTPSVDNTRTGTLTINNNDTDEAVYTFNLSGEGVIFIPPVPVLACPFVPTNVTIPAVNTIVNTYHQSTAGTLAVGSDTVTIGASTGSTNPIVRGDLLLIIQMQGGTYNSTSGSNYGDAAGDYAGYLTATAGTYEYVVALSDVTTAGGVLSITPTVNTYLNEEAAVVSGTVDKGRSRYQIIRVPRYANLTIPAGMSVTAAAWDGEKGGIVVMDVAGTLNMSTTGSINADQLGFRGGYSRLLTGCGSANCGTGTPFTTISRHASTINVGGSKGEGILGTPRHVYTKDEVNIDTGIEGYPSGTHGRGAPGNAGGGGNDDDPANNDENCGGGGGSNGSRGGKGGIAWSNSAADWGGFGAEAPGFLSTSRIILGGGGGGGTRNNAGPSSGGSGGGIVMLKVGSITNAGLITANGKNAAATDNDGGGAGGAGGSVYISATTPASLGGLTVSAQGGTGGSAWALQAPAGTPGRRHGPGGGGGGGVIYTNGAVGSADVQPGNAGITTTANDNYGSTGRGFPGITNGINNAASVAITYPTQATSCTDLAVTVTTNGLSAAVGSTVVFTVSVTNNTASAATGVSVKDLLPNGYTYVSNTPSTGAYVSGTGIWTVGTVNAGATQTLQITATVRPSGVGVKFMNDVSLYRVNQMDTDVSNNTDSTGLSSLWLRADAGTSTTTDGAGLATWTDQSIFGTSSATAANQPLFKQLSLNFNPGVTFNGTTNRMTGTSGYYSETQIAVIKPNTASLANAQVVIGSNVIANNAEVSGLSIGNFSSRTSTEIWGTMRGLDDVSQIRCVSESATALTKDILISRKNPALSFAWQLSRNGSDVTTSAIGASATSVEWTNRNYRLGHKADIAGTGSFARYFNGDILEVISYQGRLSNADVKKVSTYLALKYGITMATNYVNSEGFVVYNVSSFPNNIVGIGKDVGTGLHQRQSKSETEITASGNSLITLGNKQIIATTNNTTNGNDITNDESYFVTGDNNGSIASWTSTNAPTDVKRLTRAWKARESGTITEKIRVKVTTSRLPALVGDKSLVMIVVTNPADFATADYSNPSKIIIPMSKSGSDWQADYNFPSGISYYTFGIVEDCYSDLACIGTTKTWSAGSWTPSPPTVNDPAVINSVYNTSTNGNFVCCKLTINAALTIANAGLVEVQSDIVNNSSLTIANNGELLQYYDNAVNSGAGTASVTRTSGAMYAGDYTYWSSPVSGFNLTGIPKNRSYVWDAPNGRWSRIDSGIMTSGKGYIVMTDNASQSVAAATSVNFVGTLYNGRVNAPVFTASQYNLLGNPYPGALDAEEFLLQNYNAGILTGGLYFWTHNTRINQYNQGVRGYFNQNDYAIFTLSGGIGTGTGTDANTISNAVYIDSDDVDPDLDLLISYGGNANDPDKYVASGQGFFVEAVANSTAIFKNCMRTHDAGRNNNFYRSSDVKTEIGKNRFWLDVTNDSGSYKRMLFGHFDYAEDNFDGLYDAKTLSGNNQVELYTFAFNENTGEDEKLSIQGKNNTSFDESNVIPVGFKMTAGGAPNNFISLAKTEGLYDSLSVFLEDKYTGKVQDLKKGFYSFTSEVGEFNDRFVIKYKHDPIDDNSLEVDSYDSKNFAVSSDEQEIKMVSKNAEISTVTIYNTLGKTLHSNMNVKSDTYKVKDIAAANQVLFISVVFNDGTSQVVKLIR